MIPAVRLCSVSKRFPGSLALDRVSFDIREGECHAIMGENGAGKSTLGKLLAGIHRAEGGTIEIGGAPCKFADPLDARRAGVALVHQELAYCPNLSVAENICLGALPRHGVLLDRREMKRIAADALAEVGAEVAPDDIMSALNTAQVQLVQIAAAISTDARILIMDEPTSSLSRKDCIRLQELVRSFRASGRTIIYVSHRMEEIFEICDTVTVLRDGRHVATRAASETSADELIELMVGRALIDYSGEPRAPAFRELLRVERLSSPGKFAGISFTLHGGEILGLAGLVGAGRSEIAAALFGLDPKCGGSVYIRGERVKIRNPRDAIAAGMGLVPEDRKKQGLVLGMNCAENITLSSLAHFSNKWGFVRAAAERDVARACSARLGVRAAGLDAPAASLSGGNQQKLAVGKWLARGSKMLLLDEPTRGIDVAAKSEIHRLILELARRGHAILLISSELPELLALSTRILVLRRGRPAGRVERERASEEALLSLMMGTTTETAIEGVWG